ncbi:MAG: glycosyltransferase [Candidatus Aenigmatarchaeota archaeon]
MSTAKMTSKKPTIYGKHEFISIIVPTFNSERTVGRCMESLVKQDYPKNRYEIIVVDKDSKDSTAKICKGFGVRFIVANTSPAGARNLGAKVAKGKIVMFTDSDCIVPRNVLRKIMDDFRKHDIAGVGGSYKTFNKEFPTARFVGYEIGWRHSKQPRHTDFLGTYCCAYNRGLFIKFGGFDTSFKVASGEDPEFSFKLSEAKHKLLFDNSIFVWHTHPSSLGKYLRQQFFRAYWRVNLYNKHPDKITGDIYTGLEIPYAPLLMCIFAITGLLAIAYPAAAYVSAVSLILYFAIYLSFFRFVSQSEIGLIPFSLAVIFLRTIVWIFGFAYGLVAYVRKI